MAEKDIYILITRFLEGTISEKDNKYLQKWLTYEDNRKFFYELKFTWEQSKNAGLKLNSDIESEWQKFKVLREDEKNLKRKILIFPATTKNILRIAATIIILTGTYFTFKYLVNQSESHEIASFSSAGEIIQADLSDGSKVWLNKNSSVKFSVNNKKERQVKLEGEAYFEVSKDASKPFIVTAGHSQTRVLGTAFNIKALPNTDTIEMTVVEGKVLFSNLKNQKVILYKGEQGLAIKSTGELLKIENVSTTILWKDKTLVFVDQKVETVIPVIENYFSVKINYPPDIKDLNFSAEFHNPKLSDVISTFALSFNLEHKIIGENVYLTKK